jgi:hypothetical protein
MLWRTCPRGPNRYGSRLHQPITAMSGLFGTNAMACWSGCMPSGGDCVSLVVIHVRREHRRPPAHPAHSRWTACAREDLVVIHRPRIHGVRVSGRRQRDVIRALAGRNYANRAGAPAWHWTAIGTHRQQGIVVRYSVPSPSLWHRPRTCATSPSAPRRIPCANWRRTALPAAAGEYLFIATTGAGADPMGEGSQEYSRRLVRLKAENRDTRYDSRRPGRSRCHWGLPDSRRQPAHTKASAKVWRRQIHTSPAGAAGGVDRPPLTAELPRRGDVGAVRVATD